MANPFEKRATEFLRDDTAFLSVVTPDPLHTFFEEHASSGALYDRLCMVIGTPGSGKTTIATLIQHHTVNTLVSSPNHTEYAPLLQALSRCSVIQRGKIGVLACRIPMESEYRDFWELPYPEDVRFGLLRSFLQARAVIFWLNSISSIVDGGLDSVEIEYRSGTDVAGESIGGSGADLVMEKAKRVERAIYSVCARLVAPALKSLPSEATEPYQPFDAISSILLPETEFTLGSLKPLVILDDVHTLHPDQLNLVSDWLAKREIPISRWMMMRLDAQTPQSVLDENLNDPSYIAPDTTLQKNRELVQIWLQNSQGRSKNRRNFRSMARNMANKYLRLMPIFNRQGLTNFGDLLNTNPHRISDSNLKKLEERVESLQRKARIPTEVRDLMEQAIDRYFSGATTLPGGSDVRLSMLLILMNRHLKREPQSGLFDHDEPVDPDLSFKADASVADGARIHLLHEFGRPYYFGLDTLSDASTENAEQFLQLANVLVKASEARIIRDVEAQLPSKYQHQLLRDKAADIIKDWTFPRHHDVESICEHIAAECVKKSLEPNASLGGGANAFGILEKEFSSIPDKYPDLAHVLKYGVAYSAINIVRGYACKKQQWALVELTGPSLVKNGLTFTRGGFLERRVSDLVKALGES
ncbi:hypothetical protein [Pseudohalioglobus lutimaris]|uniref:Uncharacterized protein n=1 Tax=Pseudohalioglobus lutimaris TaxID=1737061 RepID=A0A2N5WZX0_9GAMM|nr:hypothetical protein [Pseudohalioglobus lutimaris]PLW67758.1 hypothetical protein C0039_15165 [Pseudohalioglobus lutimaris]